MTDSSQNQSARLNRAGKNRIATVLGTLVVFGVILFGCAGRSDWPEAWIYLGIYLAGVLANAWTLRRNADVINERGRIAANTKGWDKVVGVFYMIFLLAMYFAAGFDARFGWSSVPLGWKIAGGLGFALSMAIVFWVMITNTFLSTFVRIQDDRGHHVISTGPYRFVRHPMYASMVLLFWAAPLLLGSWWSLLPSAGVALVMIIRTALEDRTLQAELPGYREYTRQTRFRLLPGIW